MAPETFSETGLVYVSDSEPAWVLLPLTRWRVVRDAALKARISALGLPSPDGPNALREKTPKGNRPRKVAGGQ
ncbi:hypothetical protein MUO32_10160 [Shinella sp. CPCC 101442]|uniref:hypothetical protein n=1 Tax=Shinella sp. CPCC 101442 TaxID=2932265 RepID=UPI00215290B9|nr:hypothetical protein [Shinella sp. CPCC 101442]MCR6499395.1 hypothetical protein [Shinella sp. CPCC 101442]